MVLVKRKSDETNRFVSGKQFAVILSAQLRTYWKYGDFNNIDPTEALRRKFFVQKCIGTRPHFTDYYIVVGTQQLGLLFPIN